IFCDEDGTREFQKGYFCPACEANLSGKYDVVRVELQPSEQYKSMVLAGQRPEIIMEIASRALSFWTYQAFQERTYQEFVANKSKEKISQMEQYYEQMISKAQTEISCILYQVMHRELQGAIKSKDLEETKKRLNEISEKLVDKNRQYIKLQGMYDTLRRKAITPNLMIEGEDRRTMDTRTEQVRSSFLFPLDTGAAASSSIIVITIIITIIDIFDAVSITTDLLRKTQTSGNSVPVIIPVQAE
ncbi:hypothetical protein QZH41_018473, partial [Actinostola sp. cb2023]